MEIGQVSAVYLYDLSLYQKSFHSGIIFLKQLQSRKQTDRTMLDVLTDQLIEAAAKLSPNVCSLRRSEKWAQPIHSGISGDLKN